MKAAALLLALAASTHATVLTPENYDELTADKSVTRRRLYRIYAYLRARGRPHRRRAPCAYAARGS